MLLLNSLKVRWIVLRYQLQDFSTLDSAWFPRYFEKSNQIWFTIRTIWKVIIFKFQFIGTTLTYLLVLYQLVLAEKTKTCFLWDNYLMLRAWLLLCFSIQYFYIFHARLIHHPYIIQQQWDVSNLFIGNTWLHLYLLLYYWSYPN